MRKYILDEAQIASSSVREIDCLANCTIGFSSEDPAHPVESLFNADLESYWSSGRADMAECIVIAFDVPQSLNRIVYEVIERSCARTQEVQIEISADGDVFHRIFIQEYVFSPTGATYEKQDIKVEARDVSYLRFGIMPNKNGSGRAKITSLRLYAWHQR
jgi:hypothetical protein